MTTLSIKELIEELQEVSPTTRMSLRLVDLIMAAAGRLKAAEELRESVEERAAAKRADDAATAKVNAAVAKLRDRTVTVRED